MENISEQTILEEAREVYSLQRNIGEINDEQAARIGRNLRVMGKTILRGIYINPSRGMTVAEATRVVDNCGLYESRLNDENSGVIVGPRHEILPNNNEFCPTGIAIWGPAEK